jgi:hypothetical protein
MSKDIDTIAAELRSAEAKATSVRARLRKWTLRYEQAETSKERSQSNHYRSVANEDLRKAESRVRALRGQYQQAENEMVRHADDGFPAAMTPPHAGWKLVSNLTGQFGEVNVRRGQEVTIEMLGTNAQQLIDGRHVRWAPPSVPKRSAPAGSISATVVRPVAVAPTEGPLDLCRRVLSETAAKRGITKREAIDVIDQGLVERAIRAIGELPRTVRSGSWGSGNPTDQRTGIGTMRRITDDAYSILCGEKESTP